MKDNVIRFLEGTVTNITIARGETYAITPKDVESIKLRRLKLSSSQPEDVRILGENRILGVKAGTATVTANYVVLYNKQEKVYQAKINVSVIEPSYYTSPLAAAALPIYLSDSARDTLREKLNVTNCRELMDQVQSRSLPAACEALGCNDYTLRLWLRQAALFELEGMNPDFALLCAIAGIRNAADLSSADPVALNTALQIARPSAAALEPDFQMPAQGLVDQLLSQAAQIIPSANWRYQYAIPGEEAPAYLLRADAGAAPEQLSLSLLKNITLALPLPRLISGSVLLKGRSRDEDPTPLAGCMVSISGITNPARDRSEDDRDLYACTDEDGIFHIVMPEKYNLHECVTFTVTYQDATALAMTLVEGSQRVKTMRFVKRASEIMDAEYVEINWNGTTKPRRARQILADLDRISYLSDEIARLKKLLNVKVLSERELLEARQSLEEAREEYLSMVESLKGEIRYHQTRNASRLAYLYYQLNRTVGKLTAEVLFHLTERLRWLQGQPWGPILGQQEEEYRTEEAEEAEFQRITSIETALRCSDEEIHAIIREHLGLPAGAEKVEIHDDEAYQAMHNLICTRHFDSDLWGCESFQKLKQEAEAPLPEIERLELEQSLLENNLHGAEEEYQRVRMEHEGRGGASPAPEDETGADSPFYHLIQDLSCGVLEDCPLFLDKAERYRAMLERMKALEARMQRTQAEQEAVEKQDLLELYCEQFRCPDLEDLVLREDGPEPCTVGRYSDETVQAYRSAQAEQAWLLSILYQMDLTTNDIGRTIRNFLSSGMDAELERFLISRERLALEDPHPRALPSVRLMGEGTDAVYLPTDTAPSRVFNYTMLQRLVEPDISVNGQKYTRERLHEAIDVMRFKDELYTNQKSVPIATSLGMGYVLNMHQAWIPDGFALGNLLYSLVLAPGEEQRIIVREHQESYQVSDDAMAQDTIDDTYLNSQNDSETAAFSQAANRFSSAHSDYTYSSTAKSSGKSKVYAFFGLGASSKATSSNYGSGSSNASQTDSYDEVSSAAQAFQTEIKTESARLATAKRASIRVASSEESESVSSKIIANHNHSHVMTVQYWEVTRRYRMETAIESIDLVLFVPLKPVSFLPDDRTDTFGLSREQQNLFRGYQFQLKDYASFTKAAFAYRYANILRYSDILLAAVPGRYRGGIQLVKEFNGYPEWTIEAYHSRGSELSILVKGYFIEADRPCAALYLQNGQCIEGDLTQYNYLMLDPALNTRRDVIYGLKKLRAGKLVYRKQVRITEDGRIDRYKEENAAQTSAVFTFHLPAEVSRHDISHLTLENDLTDWSYRLSQETAYMEDSERIAVKQYEHWKYNFSHDDENSGKDLRRIAHYEQGLPECYTDPIVNLSRSELLELGPVRVSLFREQSSRSQTDRFESAAFASGRLAGNRMRFPMANLVPTLGYDEVMEIETALHHIVAHTLRYSQAVWSSLSDNERILLLEPYTIEMDWEKLEQNTAQSGQEEQSSGQAASAVSNPAPRAMIDLESQQGQFHLGNNLPPQRDSGETQTAPAAQRTEPEPLLNCVNAHKVVGFYGNCMLLPFTWPQSLAQRLGKTAGEIQDELYRYHTTNFRVPTTVLSVPTDGMVGEAVLGATNVSEKIDLTRFWNWKDSEIDHMNIDQSSLGGHSLLDRADTKSVDAPTIGVTPTAHIDGTNPLAGLLARQQPAFADALGNTDIRQLLASTDTNASAGREAVVAANTDMVKSTIAAATEVAKMAASGGLSELGALGSLGDTDNIKSALGALGMSEGDISGVIKKLESGKLNTSDLLQNVVNTVKKQPSGGGSSGGGGGGSSGGGGGGSSGGGGGGSSGGGGGGSSGGGGGGSSGGGREGTSDDPDEPDPASPQPPKPADPDTTDPADPDKPNPDKPNPDNPTPDDPGTDDPVTGDRGKGVDNALVERMIKAIRSGENAVDFYNRETGSTCALTDLLSMAEQAGAKEGCTAQELICSITGEKGGSGQ